MGERQALETAAMDHSEGTRAPADDRQVVTSVLRALQLLECFSHEQPELSLAEFSRLSGLSKTTVHRLLATLEHAGWIERLPGGEYRLTLKAFEIGTVVTDAIDLRAEAAPALAELVAEFGETAFLSIVDGGRCVCLERLDGNQPIKILALDVGKSLPLSVGGAPMALLAFNEETLLPKVLASGLPRLTERSVTSEAELRERLAEIRWQGYAMSEEDVTEGICAIGVPILDGEGKAVAAISLAGLAERFKSPRRERMAQRAIEVCDRVSQRIKYMETPERPEALNR